MNRWSLLLTCLLVAALAAGCGENNSTTDDGGADTDADLDADGEADAPPGSTVGPDGGSVTFGDWTIEFPPDVFDSPTVITGDPASGFPAGDGIVGVPYSFGPGDIDLAGRGVRVRSIYDPGGLPGGADEADLVIATVLDGRWSVLGSSVADGEGDKVAAAIDRLATFALVPANMPGLDVPPMLRDVAVSPSALPASAVAATWTWEYRFPPSPAAECSIEGVGTVASGTPIELTRGEDGAFALVCSNRAGTSRAAREFAASVPPDLTAFVAAPASIPLAAATPVTFSWRHGAEPIPAPECTIDGGVGTIESGTTRPVSLTLLELSRTFHVTCTNNAGSSSAAVTVTGVAPLSLPFVVPPLGGTITLGGFVLDVPADAIPPGGVGGTVAFDPTLPPDPGIIAMPITFSPAVYFQNPISLTMPYDEGLLAMFGPDTAATLQTLGIATLDDDHWIPLHTEIDRTAHTVTIRVNHLGSFALTASGYRNDSGLDAGGGAKDERAWGPKSSHPLRYPTNYLKAVDELAVGLPRGLGTRAFMVWDNDTTQNPTTKTTLSSGVASFSDLGERRWGAVTGDFDDDGSAELAVLTTKWERNDGEWAIWNLRLDVFDDHENSYNRIGSWTSQGRTEIALPNSYHDADIDVARFNDQSGRSRFYLVVTGSAGKIRNTDHRARTNDMHKALHFVFRVRVDGSSGARTLELVNSPNDLNIDNSTVAMYETRTACGDLNADGKDEILSIYQLAGDNTVHMKIARPRWSSADRVSFDNSVERYGQGDSTGSDVFRRYGANRPSIAVGNFDENDHADEIAVVGYRDGDFLLEIWNYDRNASPKISRLDQRRSWRDNGRWGNATTQMVVANNDTGRDEELLLLVGWQDGHAVTSRWKAWWYDYHNARHQPLFDDEMQHAHATAGDTDADGTQEWAIVFQRPSDGNYVLFQYNRDGHDPERSYQTSWTRSSGSTHAEPFVAAGCVDGDSTVVKYLNQWRTHESDTVPLVALAAPPYWGESMDPAGGDRQARDDCQTEVEFAENSGSETGHTVGTTAEASISVRVGDPLGIVEAQAGVALEQEFSRTSTSTHSTGKSTTFTCYHENNCVIYQATQWDSYQYEVLSHPDSERIGDVITIDVPRNRPVLGIRPVADFNANNGETPDIGAETFGHTLGCPGTYPPQPADAADVWKSDERPVNRGSSIGVTITDEVESSTSETRSWAIKFTFGASVAGIEFSGSRGYNEEESLSFFMGQESSYGGTVGGLIGDDWADWDYNFGTYVRKLVRSDADGLTYQVVRFWTNGVPSRTCP